MFAKRFNKDAAWEQLLELSSNRAITWWTVLACAVCLLFVVVVGVTASPIIGTALGYVLALWVLQRLYLWRYKRCTLRQQGPKI